MTKPDCYQCEHKRSISGDSHVRCVAPRELHGVEVEGDLHGIKKGWFFWPYNFDPVWLKSCNSFSPMKDKQ